MLFQSKHIRVSVEYGTATLWLDFPGEPVNALDLTRLRELDAALAAVETNPFVRILVVRSAKPAGFCAGIHPDALAGLTAAADRAAFAWVGQQVFNRLSQLDAVTVAFIDGPCLGAGLELALACDHRLCLSRPTTHLGFPDAPEEIPPCFGGRVRLPKAVGWRAAQHLVASGQTLSGREARSLGLVDHAFCERRAKIELRTFLDALETRAPRTDHRMELFGFAEERQAFARSLGSEAARAAIARQLEALQPLLAFPEPVNPIPPFPAVVGLAGEEDVAAGIVAQAVLRGSEAVLLGSGECVLARIATAQARGFVTPLEAEQARARVKAVRSAEGFHRAGLVFVAGGEPLDELAGVVPPRCILARLSGEAHEYVAHSRRAVGICFPSTTTAEVVRLPDTDADTLVALAVWLKRFQFTATLVAPARVSASLVA